MTKNSIQFNSKCYQLRSGNVYKAELKTAATHQTLPQQSKRYMKQSQDIGAVLAHIML